MPSRKRTELRRAAEAEARARREKSAGRGGGRKDGAAARGRGSGGGSGGRGGGSAKTDTRRADGLHKKSPPPPRPPRPDATVARAPPVVESSESESESDEYDHALGVYEVAEVEAFQVGMDINLLLREVHQNTVRVLSLIDVDGIGGFGDNEMVYLAAALRENRSVLTLQARFLPLTDRSLVPLCENLAAHPTIRSLDLTGTKGYDDTGRALIKLARRNTNVLHILLEHTSIRQSHQEEIALATRHNAFMCPDPRAVNPYDKVLLAGFVRGQLREGSSSSSDDGGGSSDWGGDSCGSGGENGGGRKKHVNVFGGFAKQRKEERRKALLSQLGLDDPSAPRGRKKRGKKGAPAAAAQGGSEGPNTLHAVLSSSGSKVCGDYMHGSCKYGSRCVYFHPDRTSTVVRRITAEREAREEEERRRVELERARAAADGEQAGSEPAGAAVRAAQYAIPSARLAALRDKLRSSASVEPAAAGELPAEEPLPPQPLQPLLDEDAAAPPAAAVEATPNSPYSTRLLIAAGGVALAVSLALLFRSRPRHA